MKLGAIFSSFFKIGIIGFGGGSALIPIVEKEMVKSKKLITEDEYAEHTVVSNITPGALPVKLGAASGMRIGGLPGALTGAYAVSFPGAFITVLFLCLMSLMPPSALVQIQFAAVGILAFIIMVLTKYILSVYTTAKSGGYGPICITIIAITTVVTVGKALRLVLNLLFPGLGFSATSIFGLSTLNTLLLAFFIIFTLSGKISPVKIVITSVISLLYLLAFGQSRLLATPYVTVPLPVIMAVIALYFIYRDIKKSGKSGNNFSPRPFLLQAAVFFAVPVLLSAAAIFFGLADAGFLGKAAISTVTSFGGGEAYVAVADGIFADSGLISKETLYNNILPVANALPGPILIKVLSGIGYYAGLSSGGAAGGILLSAVCFTIGVGFTCGVFALIFLVYSRFSSLNIFIQLKKFILPVICGLLISTMIAIIETMIHSCSLATGSIALILPLIALLIAAGFLLELRARLHDVLILASLGGASLLILNILARLPA